MIYIIPIFVLLILVVGLLSKVKTYDALVDGAKEGLMLVYNVAGPLIVIFVLITLMQSSGLSRWLAEVLSTPMSLLGVPREITEFVLLRPLSGSGSLALYENILLTYGTESHVSKCASVIMSSSETIFYVVTTYYSGVKKKNLTSVIIISLITSTLGVILSCVLARVI
ncbi:MAG: hypothetical protein IKD20_02805 [Clostridia bacterium]|nr:hypothetical protein [Clostridia bacterium]MBR7159947.1 hypothetical protein [Clostridia bacterium]